MHLHLTAVLSTGPDAVAARQTPRPAEQIQNPRNDPVRGSAGSGPATGLDSSGHGGMALPVRDEGSAGGGDPHLAPRLGLQIGYSRNDPIRSSTGVGAATGLDQLGAWLDFRAGRLRSGNRGGDSHLAPALDGQIGNSRNDPICGSAGSGPATGLDRSGARRDGRAGPRRRGDRSGNPHLASRLNGQLETLSNDPIRGSAGSGPTTRLDRLGARLFGGVGPRRSGDRGGDPRLAPRFDGQLETPSNDPIRGSAGSGTDISLARLEARLDGSTARLISDTPGGDPNPARRLDG